ncbi:MAG: hypothetical protein IJP43_06200 [Oscillospiraceae bacterium]|nr:hypothetical protein [Oscillospiraceae bacterium]
MKDRVPRYPGRVTLTPVEGQANTYDMARADDPTEAGTPLNTTSLMTSATAQAIFNDSNDHTVNEALGALLSNTNSRAKVEVVTYVGTGTIGQSTPTSVTFSFVPKLVWIAQADYRGLKIEYISGTWAEAILEEQALLMYGAPTAEIGSHDTTESPYSSNNTLIFTWNGNTVEWYHSYPINGLGGGHQLNRSGKTYYALAIG